MKELENDKDRRGGSVESSVLLDDWDVGADGIPIRKGDHVTEEDGELVYLHKDGTKTYFV